MKLLIAADIFPPERGGPATYLTMLTKSFLIRGVYVEIVSLNPDSDVGVVDCPVHKVGYKHKLLRYAHYLYLLIKHAKRFDVVYAMGPVNAGFFALCAARLRGVKVLTKVVGDYAWEQGRQRFGVTDSMDEFQNNTKHSFFVRLLKKIESFVVSHVDHVIVPSQYLRGIVVGWGAPEQNVSVVYNAVDFKEARKMDKPEDEKWIVSVGRLAQWKGMDTLISLMPKIIERFPEARLKIVGDGPQMENLKKLVDTLSLNNVVTLTGSVPHQEALAYMKTSDVFVLNSGYEGLSHVLLEVLSCGRPVLASNICGNPELVNEGKNGGLFTFNNADEIYEKIEYTLEKGEDAYPLVKDNEYRAQLFEQFSFTTMLTNTKSLLEKIKNEG